MKAPYEQAMIDWLNGAESRKRHLMWRGVMARLLLIPALFIVVPTFILGGLGSPRYAADILIDLGEGFKGWLSGDKG